MPISAAAYLMEPWAILTQVAATDRSQYGAPCGHCRGLGRQSRSRCRLRSLEGQRARKDPRADYFVSGQGAAHSQPRDQLSLAGVHPEVVQERLGHSTITTTLDLYSHVTDTMQSDAAAQTRCDVPACYNAHCRQGLNWFGSKLGSKKAFAGYAKARKPL